MAIAWSISASVTMRGGTSLTTSPLPAVMAIKPKSRAFSHSGPAICTSHLSTFEHSHTYCESLDGQENPQTLLVPPLLCNYSALKHLPRMPESRSETASKGYVRLINERSAL